MANLGSYGTARAASESEPDDFDYFGATIRVTPEVNEVDIVDFMDAARTMEGDGLLGIAVIKDGLKMLVHGEDFAEFWRLARANRQRVEDLSALFLALGRPVVENSTELPTQRPTDSSGGPLPTPTSSTDWPSSADYERAGRPDLALVRSRSVSVRQRLTDLAG